MSLEPWMIPSWIGSRRRALAVDPQGDSVAFAHELNAAAIRMWPVRAAPHFFDEAIDILRGELAGSEVESRVVVSLALILHNSAQLRAFEPGESFDDLPVALDHARAAATIQRELRESAQLSPLPAARAHAPAAIDRDIVMRLTLSRVLAACGLVDEASVVLDGTVEELMRDGALAEYRDRISHARRALAPLRDVAERPDRQSHLALWLA